MLLLTVPPAIKQRETSQTLTLKEGGNLNLTCAADGYPKPNITWMRPNGKPLPKPINTFLRKVRIKTFANDYCIFDFLYLVKQTAAA